MTDPKTEKRRLEELLATGRLTEARELGGQLCTMYPRDADTWYLKGMAEAQSDALDAAAQSFARVLALAPDDAVTHYNLARIQRLQGRIEDAITSYRAALRVQPNLAEAHNNLADLLRERGEIDKAEGHFREALRLRPGFPEAWYGLGLVLEARRNLAAARQAYEQAVGLQPRFVEAHKKLGIALKQLGDLEKAEQVFNQVLQISPQDVTALINLAQLHERRNKLDQAEAFARRALEVQPDHPYGNSIVASVLRQKGELSRALQQLSSIAVPEQDPLVAQAIHTELGKLYDRTGDPDQAMEHFNRSNQYMQQTAPTWEADRRQSVEVVDKLLQAYTAEWVRSWRKFSPPPPPNPRVAFLIGFPRSGTTLLDQILDSHGAIQVIEERYMMQQTLHQIKDVYPAYPEDLAAIDDDAVRRYRETYMSLLGQTIDIKSETSLVVDKFPLNICHVGLIHRLFPEAVYILALRHPCDACLSCFMQTFVHNKNMANFYNLDDATAYYAKVMELWTRYEELFDLNVTVTRYEDLVDDLQGNAASLLDALGLEWDPEVLQFNEHARRREKIATPSYNQVTRPIYREARYRWHKYQDHLSPYMNRLAPYIERFGYDG